MEVHYSPKGIYIPAADLWLDPVESVACAWISHAHRDHARAIHGCVYATAETIEFYRLRFPRADQSTRFFPLSYGEPVSRKAARLTALPAGHILGSAQLLVETSEGVLLYTGDLKLKQPVAAMPAELPTCDHLIVESTFGLPIYRFLERTETEAWLARFVEETRQAGYVPAFIGYPLGRGQELAYLLSQLGYRPAVHGQIRRYFAVYEAAGFSFENCVPYEGEASIDPNLILVVPLGFRKQLLKHPVRVALVSGWALVSNTRARLDVEGLIPYSGHCDFEELLEVVKQTGAKQIDVIHGYTEHFARILRQMGYQARAIPRVPPTEVGPEHED